MYISATAGSPSANLTLHMGQGVLGRRFKGKSAIGISGMRRLNERASLLTENYFTEDLGIFSMGLRYKRKRIAIDGAVILPVIEGAIFELAPWFSLMIPFAIGRL